MPGSCHPAALGIDAETGTTASSSPRELSTLKGAMELVNTGFW